MSDLKLPLSRAGGRHPLLCLVLDRTVSKRPLSEAVEAACRNGVDWVQLRDRELEAGALLALARELVAALRRAAGGAKPAQLIVNRRIDVALALGHCGAHLGFDALPAAEARALLGPALPLGVSAHAPAEVAEAARAGASYAHLSPLFDPRSKPATRPALGSARLREAAGHGIAVLAQGGVDAGRCGEIIAAGAAGVAVTGAVLMADDPGLAAAGLRAALDAA